MSRITGLMALSAGLAVLACSVSFDNMAHAQGTKTKAQKTCQAVCSARVSAGALSPRALHTCVTRCEGNRSK